MPVDPSSLTGKRLWLRGKDLGAAGAAVSSWPDAAARGNTCTASGVGITVAASTPNGGKAARFNGSASLNVPERANQWGVVTSSGPWSGNPSGYIAENVIDGQTSIATNNTWAYEPLPAFWQIEPYQPVVMTTYRIMPAAQYPTAWTFSGSDDGTAWTVLDSRNAQTLTAGSWSGAYTFANTTAYRYYRFNFTASTALPLNIVEIEFNGKANMSGPGRLGEAWIVVKTATTGSNNGLWNFGSSGLTTYYPLGGDGKIYESFGVSARPPAVAPGKALDQWRLYRVQVDGTNLVQYLDGTQIGSAAAQPGWAAAPTLGRNSDGWNLSGDIAELVIFDRTLTAGEAGDLITYFNTEHGLTVPGGSTGPSTITGSLAATIAPVTAALAGDVTAPPGTTGSLAATIAPVTAAITGDVLDSHVEGTLAATIAPVTAAITGVAAITGQLVATIAPVQAWIAETPDAITGQLAATIAPITAVVAGSNESTQFDSWTADLPGRTGLTLTTGDVTLEYTPPLELPPVMVMERVLSRRSVIVPALHTIEGRIVDPVTGAIRIPDDIYDTFPVIEETLGTLHVTIDAGSSGMSEDVTYWRGGMTLPVGDVMEEPFGDKSATFETPQISSLDEEPDGPTHPLWWQINRANIKLVLRRPDGTLSYLWSGVLVSDNTGNDTAPIKSREAIGALWQAAYDVRQVPNILEPTDVGTLIAKALNQVTSRNYPAIPAVTTGIPSRQRGTWSQSQLAYVQGLLATAYTEAGRQWTVAKVPNTRRDYEIRLKSDTPKWTITNGAHGVKVNLSRDITQGRNVIYGRGVAPDGYAWMGTKYPGMTRDDAPPWPGTLMGLGATGAGVSLWQQRARELGYTIAVDGTISASDVDIIKALQRRYGVQVDGVIGPQTWAATFGVGSNVGDLNAVVRLPLAADPATQKWLYNADGSIAGPNPVYDPDVFIVSDDVDFGTGVTLAEGIASAQQIVDREATPSLTGQITLETDPREGWRMLIDAGDKSTLVGYEQRDRVLHVTRRQRNWHDLTVTLDVDERSRDALTLAQIRQRNKESRRDPARRPGRADRRSGLDLDQVVPFDGESGAGIIPRHAIFGGLWTVVRIPVSQLGRIAKIEATTSGPAAKFTLALFGSPITPAHLVKYVGDPLASDSPFKANAKILEDRFGFIEAWGEKGQACGYSPGAEDEGDPLTGDFAGGWGVEYVSRNPPWVWVAEYSPVTTWISGRIYPAVVE